MVIHVTCRNNESYKVIKVQKRDNEINDIN